MSFVQPNLLKLIPEIEALLEKTGYSSEPAETADPRK
jgi:hypothetical protein